MKRPRSRAAVPPPMPVPGNLSLPRFGRWGRLLCYPFVVLQPGPGFALALLYAAQTDPEARRFGRICLALAALSFLARIVAGRASGSGDGEPYLQPYY